MAKENKVLFKAGSFMSYSILCEIGGRCIVNHSVLQNEFRAAASCDLLPGLWAGRRGGGFYFSAPT